MPPVTQSSKRIAQGHALGTPEAIADIFVISALPPPAPSSRVRARTAPVSGGAAFGGTGRTPPRSTPPPLPYSARSVAASPSSSPTSWDSSIQSTRPAPDEEEDRLIRALRAWARWPNWTHELRLKSRAVVKRLERIGRRPQVLRSIAIALIAALLGWGVGARPWARPDAVAAAGDHAPAKTASFVHEGFATDTGNVKAGSAVAAPAQPVETAKGQGRPAPKRHKGVSGQGSKLKARARSPSVHSSSAALARGRATPSWGAAGSAAPAD